jgi:hypothetical protein
MSLHYIYSNTSNSTVDITAYCRLYQFSATTDAKEGSTAHTTLVVDDPDAIFDFTGHRRIYMYEDLAAPSNQVVYNGFIQNQKVSRGPYRNGASRIWTLDLADPNVLLNRRVMNGADANRPAESDVTRMEALIGRGGFTAMTELNTVDDSLYFSGVSPVQMDAVDYRTQPCGTGYVDDCAQASGKNYFIWYREAVGEFSIWYDFAASSNWVSPIKLSNVLSDISVGSNTFAIDLEQEAVLDRDPSRVASGIMLPFDGVAVGSNTVSGTVYVQDPDTTAEFAAIDWLAPSVNVKTKAKAEARALRYLADAATEDDLIHASVKLPSSNVNDILAGQLVTARFSHLPGYESDTSFRVLSRTVTEISEDPTRAYRLDLELSPRLQGVCPDVAPTATGYYPPFIPFPVPAGDTFARDPAELLHYTRGGSPQPAGITNEWNFPTYRLSWGGSHEGFVDQSHSAWGNIIYAYPKGDGEMTVYVLATDPVTFDVRLLDVDSGNLIETVATGLPANTPYTFDVTLARDGQCTHAVQITWAGGFMAFDGVDWVSA